MDRPYMLSTFSFDDQGREEVEDQSFLELIDFNGGEEVEDQSFWGWLTSAKITLQSFIHHLSPQLLIEQKEEEEELISQVKWEIGLWNLQGVWYTQQTSLWGCQFNLPACSRQCKVGCCTYNRLYEDFVVFRKGVSRCLPTTVVMNVEWGTEPPGLISKDRHLGRKDGLCDFSIL